MRLHVARSLSHVILEPARRGIEGIADGYVDIFVGLVFRAAPLHDDLLAGDGDVDADIEKLALVMMAMRSFDDDPTAGDPLIEPVEPADLVSDVRFDGVGRVHVAERDLQRDLHAEASKRHPKSSDSAISPAVQLSYPARRPGNVGMTTLLRPT